MDYWSDEAMSNWIKLIEALIWPLTSIVLISLFYSHLKKLFKVVVARIEKGAEFETPWISVGSIPQNLDSPNEGDPVTENHIALVHSSWRYSQKDKEFGKRMYAFHAVIQAEDSVLDRIEYVQYMLDRSYPNRIQNSTDRENRFKLKELAWGESTLHAHVKIKSQKDPIKLSRYINLSETGPRI